MSPRQPTRLEATVCLGLVTAALAVYWFIQPGQVSGWLFCVFHRVTGWYCPGCGSTRAVHLLLHGHALAAVRHNLLLVPALVYLGWAFVAYQRSAWFGTPPLASPRAAVYRAVGLVIVVFWVLRNLPWWPCTLLAPPAPLPVSLP